MNELETKKYLASLSDTKLVELIYSALEKRNEGNSKLLLAETYHAKNTGKAHIAVAAAPSKSVSITAKDRADFINNGVCNICKIEITAISKKSVCPVCQNEVGLT